MKRAGMPKKAFVAPRAAAERRRLVCQLLPGPRRFLGQRRRCGAFGKLLFCFSFFVFFFGFFFVVSLRIRLHLYLSSVSFSSGLFFLAFASSSSFFRRIFVLIVIIYSFFFLDARTIRSQQEFFFIGVARPAAPSHLGHGAHVMAK